MAKPLSELQPEDVKIEFIEFSSCTFYNEYGDCIHAYFDNCPTRAEYINKDLTLYRALDTNEIVGVQIKGILGMVMGRD